MARKTKWLPVTLMVFLMTLMPLFVFGEGMADKFQKLTYQDKATGITLTYHLFLPQGYHEGGNYPLVMFMHDMSGADPGADADSVLNSNRGACVWAEEENQKEHPCIVLVPHFDRQTVDDNYTVQPDVYAALNLLKSTIHSYAVDSDRVYVTGQSMGCMMSYVMLSQEPDLFAAGLLVAGQWDPTVIAPMAKKNLLLVSCTGDEKSSNGVAAALKVWEANGATTRQFLWPLDTTSFARTQEMAELLKKGGNIHFVQLNGGDHRTTWQKAYDIEGFRDWLFAQRRPMQADKTYSILMNPQDTTTLVAALHGDAHGDASENTINAIEKAYLKGAQLAVVNLCMKDNKPALTSGEYLQDALAQLKQNIVLLAVPDSKTTAKKTAQLVNKLKARHQVLFYGSAYGNALDTVSTTDRRILVTTNLKQVMIKRQGLDKYTNIPNVVNTPQQAKWWHAVDSIDFSPRHKVLIQNADGSQIPMDQAYFESEKVAPGTWKILNDGDYCYLVEGDSMAVCIDTGYGAGNLRKYCQTLTDKPVEYVLNTHSHFDHTAGNAYFDCAFMSQKAVEKATIPYASFKGIYFPRNYPVVVVKEGDVIHLGGRDLKVLSIPNHTDDGIAFLDRSHRLLFPGDEILAPTMNRLNVSVAQFAANMQKLVDHISEYDAILGGSTVTTDVNVVKNHLACALQLLNGGAQDTASSKKKPYVKTVPVVPEGAEAVYVRHAVRTGDSAGADPDPSEYSTFTYAGVTLMYLKDKIR